LTQPQPPITRTTHTLPFDKLSPRDFERLCLWLVEREGYERAEHLGAAGSEQGRDIVAWRGLGPSCAYKLALVHLSERDSRKQEDYVWLCPKRPHGRLIPIHEPSMKFYVAI